jgi:TRAP-type C4-dicarboxylate transport system substrate-binding protein
MKKYFVSIAVVFGLIMYLIPTSSDGQEKVIELRYANFHPAPHKISLLCEQWCRELEKRTNGRVRIAYFPGGTLMPAAQTYDSIQNGIGDIGYTVPGYTRGKFPLTEVVDLPIGLKTGYAASKLANEYFRKFKPKEFDDIKVLYLHGHGPGLLHTKKPVYKLEDLRGMKIRASGLVIKIVQALGAASVGMTMPETYDALRTGVVDGGMAPYEALQGSKWGEIITSTTENSGASYTDVHFIIMNKDRWNSLPPDIQKIIEKLDEEWIEKQGRLWDEIDKEAKAYTLKRGNKVIVLSKEEDARWKAKVQPLLEDYVKAMKAKGLPGEEALKFCLDYAKAH